MSKETSALTPRQAEILDFVRRTLVEAGAPPTREEIADAFGFRSLNAAEQHLQALQKKGLIELVPGTSRGIRLKGAVTETVRALKQAAHEFGSLSALPLIGKVAAGSPILAQENVIRRPAVDPLLFRPRADYLLEVRGMSMRDAGILDGDWLAVHKQAQAQSGQIVVARLGDEVTVKRFRRTKAGVELIPENPEFETLVVPARDGDVPFAIEGIAVGLLRNNMLT